MMASSAGEAAVSGVSLVDMINVVIINIFAARAAGGAVVTAQLLGRGCRDVACQSAGQLLNIVAVISLLFSGVMLLFRVQIPRLFFGAIAPAVMENCLTYLVISAFSYPFLVLAQLSIPGYGQFQSLLAGPPFHECSQYRRQCALNFWFQPRGGGQSPVNGGINAFYKAKNAFLHSKRIFLLLLQTGVYQIPNPGMNIGLLIIQHMLGIKYANVPIRINHNIAAGRAAPAKFTDGS